MAGRAGDGRGSTIVMEIDDWAARWKEGRIGFHEGRTNAFLERHVHRLGAPPRRVLVPLCGKTEDMAFLAAQGHHVVGVEAVEDAVKAFFDEHGLTPIVSEHEHIRAYSSDRVTIFAGDVFACTRELIGTVDALYDRAALVALGPTARPRYVAHLRSLLGPGALGLVLIFEFDDSKIPPAPYPVSGNELRSLYGGARVAQVDEGPLEGPRFRQAGIDAKELCFAIEL
jgi:thiopurine S-methyltransferase